MSVTTYDFATIVSMLYIGGCGIAVIYIYENSDIRVSVSVGGICLVLFIGLWMSVANDVERLNEHVTDVPVVTEPQVRDVTIYDTSGNVISEYSTVTDLRQHEDWLAFTDFTGQEHFINITNIIVVVDDTDV